MVIEVKDLIGFPIRITVGKTINEGLVEIKIRSTDELLKVSKQEAIEKVKEVINQRERKRKGYQEWEKIVSIDFAGVKDVYDFEVPESHMFIANGIVSHNCGKSQMLTFVEKTAPKARYVAGRSASGAGLCVSPNSFVLTNPGGMPKIQDLVEQRLVNNIEFKPGVWKEENISDVKIQSMSNKLKIHSKKPNALWKLEAPRKMFKITLSSGKQIELTGNTSLFFIEEGFTYWRKSNELKVGEYVATPRTLIGGVIDKKYILDFVNSNPVVHNVKPFVKEIANLLVKKYGSLRKACKDLKISENQLYHHWVNDFARGNIMSLILKSANFDCVDPTVLDLICLCPVGDFKK